MPATPTKAFINYALLRSHILLICCYHEQSTSKLIYLKNVKDFEKDKEIVKKSLKLRTVDIADSSDKSLIEKNILTALGEIKSEVDPSGKIVKKVVFHADVNICFSNKYKVADFLMDNKLPNLFDSNVIIERFLETTLYDVAEKADKVYKKLANPYPNYPVTIRTKAFGADRQFPPPTLKQTNQEPNFNTVTLVDMQVTPEMVNATAEVKPNPHIKKSVSDDSSFSCHKTSESLENSTLTVKKSTSSGTLPLHSDWIKYEDFKPGKQDISGIVTGPYSESSFSQQEFTDVIAFDTYSEINDGEFPELITMNFVGMIDEINELSTILPEIEEKLKRCELDSENKHTKTINNFDKSVKR
ncbi:hypothetical protein ACNVED_11840 [Legionella sp. D16C41]|uniref:hypothetical protein n=1 Tax=Legionella sp. D16C41 TaxID=3402688 RepID=UPI003AF8522D